MTHQPYFCEGSEAMLELETMVDKVGVANVLYALAHIAHAKADHIKSNWQDKTLARAWEQDGNRITAFASTKIRADLP